MKENMSKKKENTEEEEEREADGVNVKKIWEVIPAICICLIQWPVS
jgi:hypothetical protein